jgi:hypothetical protein
MPQQAGGGRLTQRQEEGTLAVTSQRKRQAEQTMRRRTRVAGQVPAAPRPARERVALQRAAVRPSLASAADILALQRACGNRAVGRLIQSKLVVGESGDRYEREADRVAEQVVRSPARLQAGEEGTTGVQRKPLAASITPLVQPSELAGRRPPGTSARRDDGAAEGRLASRRGSGSPLPDGVRAAMEPRFGADLSEVRVHTDGEAAQMARDLGARAFTSGQEIYFGAGRYEPSSRAGKRLVAHELTHVVQQGGQAGKGSRNGNKGHGDVGQGVRAVADPAIQRKVTDFTSWRKKTGKLWWFTKIRAIGKKLKKYHKIKSNKPNLALSVLGQLYRAARDWVTKFGDDRRVKETRRDAVKSLRDEAKKEFESKLAGKGAWSLKLLERQESEGATKEHSQWLEQKVPRVARWKALEKTVKVSETPVETFLGMPFLAEKLKNHNQYFMLGHGTYQEPTEEVGGKAQHYMGKPAREIAEMIDRKVGRTLTLPAVVLLAGCFLGCGEVDDSFAHEVYKELQNKDQVYLVALKGEFTVSKEGFASVKGKIVRDPTLKKDAYKRYFEIKQQIKDLKAGTGGTGNETQISELEKQSRAIMSQELGGLEAPRDKDIVVVPSDGKTEVKEEA